MTLEDKPPRSEAVQYATGEEQRAIINSFKKKNKVAGLKGKQNSVVDVKSKKQGREAKIYPTKCRALGNKEIRKS